MSSRSSSLYLSEEEFKQDEVCLLIPPDHLKRMVVSPKSVKSKPKKIRNFYKQQNSRIFGLLDVHDQMVGRRDGVQQASKPTPQEIQHVVAVSFIVNLLLFGVKVFGAVWSFSLALIASTVDSFLDLLSGAILYVTERAGKKYDPYKYPEGKSRMEPIGVIVFAAAMGMASLQLLNESLQYLIEGLSSKPYVINMDIIVIFIFAGTIVIKFALFSWARFVLRKYPDSAIVEALMQDHRNDTITNTLGFCCALVAADFRVLWFLDPIGAMALAAIIFISWTNTALEQIGKLIGISAPSEFIGQLTYLAACHDDRIVRVDKVLAYHFGVRYLAEIDIVLHPDTPLQISHDIGEALQNEVESLDEVERAFVHLDFETEHKPEH